MRPKDVWEIEKVMENITMRQTNAVEEKETYMSSSNPGNGGDNEYDDPKSRKKP